MINMKLIRFSIRSILIFSCLSSSIMLIVVNIKYYYKKKIIIYPSPQVRETLMFKILFSTQIVHNGNGQGQNFIHELKLTIQTEYIYVIWLKYFLIIFAAHVLIHHALGPLEIFYTQNDCIFINTYVKCMEI